MRLSRHDQFLTRYLKSPETVQTAALSELAILCEICFNVHKIPLNKASFPLIMNHLPVIRHSGKCRDGSMARQLLQEFGSLFLPKLIRTCRSNAALDKI